MNDKTISAIIVAAVIIIGVFLVSLFYADDGAEGTIKEESRAAAKDFINSSPTYLFDGFDLDMRDSYDIENCTKCWEFVFTFKSRQAGYGNRSGHVLAQVITPHVASVKTINGVVTSAILDGKWDMISQRFIGNMTTDNTTEEDAFENARDFVLNSSTYSFDGYGLSHQETTYPDIAGCEPCWQFIFDFNSTQAGYGNRSGEMLAQVITPHEAVITMHGIEVSSAILDGTWDMMEQEMLTPVREASLELIADNLTAPVAFVSDGLGRMYIVEQTGLIKVIDNFGELKQEPFLDLRDKIVDLQENYDERGLLGLDFHPDYVENGLFYVYYSAPLRAGAPNGWDHTSHISEFTVSSDPNIAEENSERIIMRVDQPQSNHNGGQLTFGPDGFLYIPLGDGGGANDIGLGHPPLGNGQDITTILGSIIRLGVDVAGRYGIPSSNPFVGSDSLIEAGGDARMEIYAYGFRNPFHISFDLGGEHELFVGDAGQNRWEEVDIVSLGGNYGWNIMEGSHCFDPQNPDEAVDNCPDTGPYGEPLIGPIIEYKNSNADDGLGLVVVGGYVYRGSSMPSLYGDYIFADWRNSFSNGEGTIYVADRQENWDFSELDVGTQMPYILGFGQDESGEVYVLSSKTSGPGGNNGSIYRIIPS